MNVKNIKFSLQIDQSILCKKINKNEKQKMLIGSATVVVYGHSPKLLNVTGVKSMSEVKSTINFIQSNFGVNVNNMKIDNIFVSHKDFKNINMMKLFYYAREKFSKQYIIDYNIELFPGMYLKTKKQKTKPTLILFRTGSYVIVGAKSIYQVKTCIDFINNLFNKFVK